MNALTNHLKQLPGLKSSDDFAAAITDLETEHAEAVAAVGELEAGRESAIFDGGNLDKLEADVASAEGRVKTLAIAMAGARKRHEAAAEAEAQAKLVALTQRRRSGLVFLWRQLRPPRPRTCLGSLATYATCG